MRVAVIFEHLPTSSGWLLIQFENELEETHHLAAGFVLNISHTQLTIGYLLIITQSIKKVVLLHQRFYSL